MTDKHPILWQPTAEQAAQSTMGRYVAWLAAERGLKFDGYDALWRWSVSDLDGFWTSIVEYFDIKLATPYSRVVSSHAMPGATWFDGAHLNFADQIIRHAKTKPTATALISQSETFGRSQTSWAELAQQVASVAAHLGEMGVRKGDRVVAILPTPKRRLLRFWPAPVWGQSGRFARPIWGTSRCWTDFARSRRKY